MSETIILDASALTPAPAVRTQLDITQWIAVAGPDWGDGAITAFMAQQAVGSSPVDYQLPNRIINIPLILKTVSGTSFSTINTQLQQKVATFQREGGWIMRQFGSTSLYADVVNATLHLGGAWLQAYKDADVDATLQLECIPDWYGDEVTLDTLSGTGAVSSVLLNSGVTAVVAGDHGGRVRFQVSDTSANDQHALLWGVRSRNYSGATTAALSYEAEALSPLNGAVAGSLSGASGGSAVIGTSFPAATWVPMLYTTLTAGSAPMTHVGNYRAWARCYSGTATPQFQFQWGVGALSVPTTNDPVRIPGTAAFYMLDLGPVSIQAPPVGPTNWFGVIQTQVDKASDQVAIDRVFFQPLDESSGQLRYVAEASPATIYLRNDAGTAVDDATSGTQAWSNPGNVTASLPLATASITMSNYQDSHYLKATNFGFSIPTGATITGIEVLTSRSILGANALMQDRSIRLVKAGTLQTPDKATFALWPGAWQVDTYGGSRDLWSGTWTPSDINNSGFGVAFAAHCGFNTTTAQVDWIRIGVYFTLASGFTVAQDAVVYANKTAELRTDSMIRSDQGGTIYAPVSQVTGDLPRLPPSGLENRPVQVFIKPTRGDLDSLPDAGLDGLSVIPKVRPSYLFRP